jgi:hypothetical protein
VLAGDAHEVLVGLQIDAPQALPVRLQAKEVAVGIGELWQRRARSQFGQRQACFRGTAQGVADAAGLLAAALARSLQLRFAAGARLPFVGDGRLSLAQALGGVAMRGPPPPWRVRA